MAKSTTIKPKKERATKYEEKVTFSGTFQDMVNISLTGAGAKKTKNMKYIATIIDFNFHPLVEIQPSTLYLTVTTEIYGNTTQLKFVDSIENLSKKFGFIIEKEGWNFSGLKGKKCNIEKNDDGYHFISFVD